MKTVKFILILLLTSLAGFAQVGIGNTDPKASLDISASNTTTPSNTDGILIPRIDNFPSPNPSSEQNGMMVFVTGNGAPTKGFYYWDNGTTNWISVVGIDTKNTLDGAYDEGGSGNGRLITADNGAVEVSGEDGFQVTGTFGSGNNINLSGAGVKMFFNPRKAAFRAGEAGSNEWNSSNVGEHSVAFGIGNESSGVRSTSFGLNNEASGAQSTAFGTSTHAIGFSATSFGFDTNASNHYSTAFGASTTANGWYSTSYGGYTIADGYAATASGWYTTAPSFAETTIGMFSTNYSAIANLSFDSNDRLFTIGNGETFFTKSNALTIYKSGLMNINDAYNMPLTDGTNGQVMTTDGSGNVTFSDIVAVDDNDWTNAGSFLHPTDGISEDISIGKTTSPNGKLDIASDKTYGIYINNLHNGSSSNNSIYNIFDTTTSTGLKTGIHSVFSTDLAGNQLGIYNSFNNDSPGDRTGVDNYIIGNSSGEMIGNKNYIALTSGNGDSYGTKNSLASERAGIQYGVHNFVGGGGLNSYSRYGTYSHVIASSTGGAAYGTRLFVTGIGTGNKYGVYSEISNTAAGTNNWAGYFLGSVYVGTNTVNGYNLPATDGTNGQVMTTDGAGNVTFQNAAINTDNQNISGSMLSGTNLTIGIENGSSQVIDLSSLAGVEKIDDLIDGKSDNDGTDNGSSLFLGVNAGANDDSTHNFNVGMGFEALQNNISSWGNTAIGYQAMQANTIGMNSTATGSFSLTNNLSGTNNSAFGNGTLSANTSGSFNSAIGQGSLNSNTDGSYNTALGYWSLLNNDSGARNVALGSSSGYTNSTGSKNVFIGYQSGYFEMGSEKLYIENSNADANNALIYGEFDNNILRINGEFQIGNPVTTGYTFPLTDGSNNQVMITDGSGNLSFQDIVGDGNTQNTLDEAYDEGGIGNGRLIIADNGAVEIGGEDGFQITGTYGSGDLISLSGGGTRLFFNPRKSAFRAGTTSNTEWDNTNIGNYSTAFGDSNIASGEGSTATGFSNTASGVLAFATGEETTASGASAVTFGVNTTASGNYSMASGYLTEATSDYATAFGNRTEASGNQAVAFGFLTDASGSNSVAFGDSTTASGDRSVAFGNNNTASGGSSAAFGVSNISSGTASFSVGSNNSSSSNYSITFGVENNATNTNTFAHGYRSTASGSAAVAMGLQNNAPSWGEMTVGTFASTYAQNSTASWHANDRVFTVGNGTITTSRSNALTIYKNGLMNINDEYNMPLTDGANGQVMTTDGTGNVTFQNIPTVTDTDNQTIDVLNLNGTDLEISLEDDGQATQTLDLSSLQDGTGTDNQQIDTFTFNSSSNVLTLEMEDDGQVPQTINLSSLNPQKAAAHLTLSADQSNSGSGTTKVVFDTEGFDIGNNFDTATDVFIVPEDGIYRVNAQIAINSSISTGSFDIRIRVDGSQVRITAYNHSGTGNIIRQITSLLELTAGQTIDIAYQRATGVTVNSNNSITYFDIEQL
ncbi:hypothetical protein [Psychroserpens ponticola]|uniref:C1q domain-containing protein n=1 Tax=Psychroserpens ponticola TaxID=2932268 RepID=A0ABY7RXY7_9FLAO|nr:hypothetical protein [Psychroserpens ponticola]WCO02003.1 hypothetical protein MUN68_000585 [Psychroserpens ponticola]